MAILHFLCNWHQNAIAIKFHTLCCFQLFQIKADFPQQWQNVICSSKKLSKSFKHRKSSTWQNFSSWLRHKTSCSYNFNFQVSFAVCNSKLNFTEACRSKNLATNKLRRSKALNKVTKLSIWANSYWGWEPPASPKLKFILRKIWGPARLHDVIQISNQTDAWFKKKFYDLLSKYSK